MAKENLESKKEDEAQEEKEMPFLDHLEELRWRIIWSLVSVFIGAVVVFAFKEYAYNALVLPFKNAAPGEKLIFLKPVGAIMVYLEISLFGGIIISLPFIFYQLWKFVAPGLYKRERGWALSIIVVSTFSFLVGAAFSYFGLIPLGLNFLLTYQNDMLIANITIQEYLSFILTLIFVSGLVFEMPLVAFFLTRIGLLSPKFMREKRRYAIVLTLILAAVLTPPDVMTQILLAVPLIILYEISILVSYFASRGKKEEAEDDNDNNEKPKPPALKEPDKPDSPDTPQPESEAMTGDEIDKTKTEKIAEYEDDMYAMLPDSYKSMSETELIERIKRVKMEMGQRLIILGHHYQRDDIINLSDFTGDSFKLAKLASEQNEAEYVVFCGVNFMAESAGILSRPNQTVILPDHDAGCPLAEFAEISHVKEAWEIIGQSLDLSQIIPLTYMNSTSEIKAFCGDNRGAVCTSSNAANAFRWALDQAERVFFFPDENLGRNTASLMEIPSEEIVVWDPNKPNGGLTSSQLFQSKVILWKGHCHVHTRFTVDNVREMRRDHPDALIVVHPECKKEVVDLVDANGSTEQIIRMVAQAEDGKTIIVGTEINMVNRLAQRYTGKTVLPLARSLCPNMYKINLQNLCWSVENLGKVNQVKVDKAIAESAKKALERMLEIS